MLRFCLAGAALASAIFVYSVEAASTSKRHVLFPFGKTAPSGETPTFTSGTVTPAFNDGRSSDEFYTQHLTNVRRMMEATTSQPGRNSLNRYFRRTAAIYRRQGYGKIATSLKKAHPTLIEIGTAESARDVNGPRARRAIRSLLQNSLRLQTIVSPTSADPIVPLYTALAASYGAQLKSAYRNLRQGRRLTKGFGKSRPQMWLGDLRSPFSGSLSVNLGNGLTYFVETGVGGYNSVGSTLTTVGLDVLGTGSLRVDNGSSILGDSFDGTLIALPADSPSPGGTVFQIDPSSNALASGSTLTLGTTDYDLTAVPTDPPHRIYGIPEEAEIPEGAIVIAPVEAPNPTPTPEP